MTNPLLGVSRAVEVVAAWLESDGTAGSDELFWSRFTSTVVEGPEAEAALAVGLAKLAGILLVKVSAATGVSERDVLQQIAQKYAG